jgi:hypothetical protein
VKRAEASCRCLATTIRCCPNIYNHYHYQLIPAAALTGLQPMIAYAVSVRATNSAGTSPETTAPRRHRPALPLLMQPSATITSAFSHQTGTLTVAFSAPADDTPIGCVLNYTLGISPGNNAVHVTSSPATFIYNHPLAMNDVISIAASNAFSYCKSPNYCKSQSHRQLQLYVSAASPRLGCFGRIYVQGVGPGLPATSS